MELKFTPTKDCNVLTIKGELNTAAAAEIQQEIDRIAAIKDKNLMVDCSELAYIASAGLRILLTLRKATGANGLSMTIKGAQPAVMTVLKVTNFDKFFNIIP